MKQIVIAIGREFGSGGLKVAEMVAEHYNIPLYHKQLLDEVAKEGEYRREVVENYDEKPINLTFMQIPLGGVTTSI